MSFAGWGSPPRPPRRPHKLESARGRYLGEAQPHLTSSPHEQVYPWDGYWIKRGQCHRGGLHQARAVGIPRRSSESRSIHITISHISAGLRRFAHSSSIGIPLVLRDVDFAGAAGNSQAEGIRARTCSSDGAREVERVEEIWETLTRYVGRVCLRRPCCLLIEIGLLTDFDASRFGGVS